MTFKTSVAVAALAACAGFAAQAEPSYQIGGTVGAWSNEYGVDGDTNYRGIGGEEDRAIGSLDFSVSNPLAYGWTGEFELGANFLEKSETGDEDVTHATVDATVHGFREIGGVTAGAFLGFGRDYDDGDSYYDAGYSYGGFEAWKALGEHMVYGQIGLIDSYDEYQEGTDNAVFANIGGKYAFDGLTRLTGSLAYANGDKLETQNTEIVNVNLGIERDFGAYTGVAGYEWNQIKYYNSGRYGDTFHELFVGVRVNLGGHGEHAPDLPDVGKWVAYNANEIEQY